MSAHRWDEEYDVVVIGFGGAGACAAIEAHDSGARVLVIERFAGGGATKMSGGVIYTGGGTRQQRAAGFADTPEMMYRYMMREMNSNRAPGGDAYDGRALRVFCKRSAENLSWLESLGLVVPETYFPGKTNQPPGGYGLYFSGNEKQYAGGDTPVPRGHVPLGKGMSGGFLYQTLRQAVIDRGIRVKYRCRSERLITDADGSVIGIRALELKKSPLLRALHGLLYNLGFISSRSRKFMYRLEKRFGAPVDIRAHGGVIICSGGFVYDKNKFLKYAPNYRGCLPLGTAGDDGSGIELGQGAGGVLDSMDVCAASRFIYPPEAFISGILVNMEGVRFCDETLYGASISRNISLQPQRRAYLIIDSARYQLAKKQVKKGESLRGASLISILKGEMNAIIYRRLTTFVNLHFNRKKAESISMLAHKCGIPEKALQRTIEQYNKQCDAGADREFGKMKNYMEKLGAPPFYAIDCRLDTLAFPSPCLTMGGLKIKGLSSQVLRRNGSVIPGLYAAGRSASGICSRSYVSGFSLADCVFSGRNAGSHAARQALRNRKSRMNGRAV